MALTPEQMALLSDRGNDNFCHVYFLCSLLVWKIPSAQGPMGSGVRFQDIGLWIEKYVSGPLTTLPSSPSFPHFRMKSIFSLGCRFKQFHGISEVDKTTSVGFDAVSGIINSITFKDEKAWIPAPSWVGLWQTVFMPCPTPKENAKMFAWVHPMGTDDDVVG